MIPLRDVNPTTRLAFVTIAIILANLAIFFAVQPSAFLGIGTGDRATQSTQAEFLYEYALVPCEVTHLEPLSDALIAECAGTDRPERADRAGDAVGGDQATASYFPDKVVAVSFLASLFLHADIVHLLGNVWFLWIFGNNVEEHLGALRYALFYLAGGIVASLAHIVTDPNSVVPVIGASGAIAAVMGAYLVQSPGARVVSIIPPFVFFPFRLPAWTVLIAWFALQFATDPDSGVAWTAHVAGFVFGVVLGRPLMSRPPSLRGTSASRIR